MPNQDLRQGNLPEQEGPGPRERHGRRFQPSEASVQWSIIVSTVFAALTGVVSVLIWLHV